MYMLLEQRKTLHKSDTKLFCTQRCSKIVAEVGAVAQMKDEMAKWDSQRKIYEASRRFERPHLRRLLEGSNDFGNWDDPLLSQLF